MNHSGLTYLASPYSSANPALCTWRFHAVAWYASTMMQKGHLVFSPIAHTHPIAEYGLPKGWDFWQRYDHHFLDSCTAMIVLKLSGWDKSIGIAEEIKIMLHSGKPIEYHDFPAEGFRFVGQPPSQE